MTAADGGEKTPSGSKTTLAPPLPFASLMKNVDDCDRPACDDTVSAMSAAFERLSRKNAKGEKVTGQKGEPAVKCPPTKGEIGTSTWTLLHTMAAWYPDQPSRDDKRQVAQFMDALARFYPCTWCADDFRANLKKSPVRAQSREDFCLWLCEQHNIVNEKIGKPQFMCDMKVLDERWRKSTDPKCQKSKN